MKPVQKVKPSVGLYMCLQSVQTALLFENLPPEISRDTIVSEAKRMLARYLCMTR